MSDLDDLERELLAIFGPIAADIDNRARVESGVDPAEVVQRVLDDEARGAS